MPLVIKAKLLLRNHVFLVIKTKLLLRNHVFLVIKAKSLLLKFYVFQFMINQVMVANVKL
jgi:hypothetical protein